MLVDKMNDIFSSQGMRFGIRIGLITDHKRIGYLMPWHHETIIILVA